MSEWWSPVLPIPSRPMNMNDRASHWTRAKQVREWRTVGWTAGNMARPKPVIDGFAIYTLHLGVKSLKVRRDPSNLVPTSKAVCDGLTDAKFWIDDDSTRVRQEIPVITTDIPPNTFRIHIEWSNT